MFFRRLPIQYKLVSLILLTSLTVLLVAGITLLSYEYRTYRLSTARNLSTMADIVAANSSAALMYDDKNLAHENLAVFRNELEVAAAALYDRAGKPYATYSVGPAQTFPAAPGPDGITFQQGRLLLNQPVIQAGRRVGTLFMEGDLAGMYNRLRSYAIVLFGVFVGATGLTLFLSALFQRRISRPILQLAEIARTVSDQKDYTVRAEKADDDELGFLTEAFNTMLEQIQASDSALRSKEEHLRLVADHASVLLVQCDREGRYLFVNRAYANRYGTEPAALIGRHVVDVIGEAAYDPVRPYMERVLAGYRQDFELEIPYPALGHLWVHFIFVPQRDHAGAVMGLVGVLVDVTVRKREAQELERARDEALASSRAKDDFLAALSHELRTPLNPVLLLASEAAVRAELPPDIRADFEIVRKNVELEARLIDDLLDLTRITRGKLVLDSRVVETHAVLQDAIANVRSDLDAKRIRLSLELTSGPSRVWGDPIRLQQVFWNVLKNAVKFTPEGGAIGIASRSEDGVLAIAITDSGIGMTAPELARVFDAFAQGEHAAGGGSHRFGGLGLGLAICRSVVELHAGRIQAASDGPDRGAVFTVTLPLPHGENRRLVFAPAEPIAAPAAAGRDGPGSRGTVLLVEDHTPTRLILEHLLGRRHYRVLSAGSVEAGRALAGTAKIDLVISDIGLPDGSGYELMRTLRETYGLRGIALTGYGTEEDVALSQQSGFAVHLTKPVRVQMLDQALAEVGAS